MPENNKSNITLTDRKYLKINGVEGVVGLSETEVGVIVCGDIFVIKGQNIKAEKLSVETGELFLTGQFVSFKFEEKRQKIGLVKRIFK